MTEKINICAHCGREFNPNPKVKKQRYCGNKPCQRARRALWQRRKMASDPDYRDNKIRCQRQWHENHSGYYKNYRAKHPEYAKRNKFLQQMRDIRRRKNKYGHGSGEMLARLDSLLKPYYSRRGSIFKLIPQDDRMLAKLDSLKVKLVPVRAARDWS